MANSVHILMRRFITSHLIWIYTVCTVSGLVYRATRVTVFDLITALCA